MTNQELARLLLDVAKVAESITADRPELAALKTSAEAFAAEATSALPAKDDGTAYTNDELNAFADGNHEKATGILGRHAAEPPATPAPITGADPGDEKQ